MERTFVILIQVALAAASVVVGHTVAMAFDNVGGYRFVIVGNLDSDAERARLLSMARGSRIATIQRELSADPVFLRQLRNEGLALGNVVGRARAGNGRMIVYVR